jgi:hypothetical protein
MRRRRRRRPSQGCRICPWYICTKVLGFEEEF